MLLHPPPDPPDRAHSLTLGHMPCAGWRYPGALFAAAFSCFMYIMPVMWSMYDVTIREVKRPGARLSLQILRLYTVGFWAVFPPLMYATKFGIITDIQTEEWIWCVADFLGKVVFCSSLIQGNFLTMDQRKFIAMRIVEESNRCACCAPLPPPCHHTQHTHIRMHACKHACQGLPTAATAPFHALRPQRGASCPCR